MTDALVPVVETPAVDAAAAAEATSGVGAGGLGRARVAAGDRRGRGRRRWGSEAAPRSACSATGSSSARSSR